MPGWKARMEAYNSNPRNVQVASYSQIIKAMENEKAQAIGNVKAAMPKKGGKGNGKGAPKKSGRLVYNGNPFNV